jgi:hypothetical protein
VLCQLNSRTATRVREVYRRGRRTYIGGKTRPSAAPWTTWYPEVGAASGLTCTVPASPQPGLRLLPPLKRNWRRKRPGLLRKQRLWRTEGDAAWERAALANATEKQPTTDEKEANKEKGLLVVVGAVLVKYMSKYKKELDKALPSLLSVQLGTAGPTKLHAETISRQVKCLCMKHAWFCSVSIRTHTDHSISNWVIGADTKPISMF